MGARERRRPGRRLDGLPDGRRSRARDRTRRRTPVADASVRADRRPEPDPRGHGPRQPATEQHGREVAGDDARLERGRNGARQPAHGRIALPVDLRRPSDGPAAAHDRRGLRSRLSAGGRRRHGCAVRRRHRSRQVRARARHPHVRRASRWSVPAGTVQRAALDRSGRLRRRAHPAQIEADGLGRSVRPPGRALVAMDGRHARCAAVRVFPSRSRLPGA